MKNLLKILILPLALFGTAAIAQPAHIDYSKQSPNWHDKDGNISVETDYNGRNKDDRYQAPSYNNNKNYKNKNYNNGYSRKNWRDTKKGARFNSNHHNGYYANGYWHYGAPKQSYYNQRGFSLGYHPWQRGQKLGNYNRRFEEVDYRNHNLRAPPRGYRWVRDDRGDYLLAAIVGGLIAEVVLNSLR